MRQEQWNLLAITAAKYETVSKRKSPAGGLTYSTFNPGHILCKAPIPGSRAVL
jgi:hypothetical protein